MGDSDVLAGVVSGGLRCYNRLREFASDYQLRLGLETVLRVGLADAALSRASAGSAEERTLVALRGAALLGNWYHCASRGVPERAVIWGFAVMDDVQLAERVRAQRDRAIDGLLASFGGGFDGCRLG